MESLYKGYRCPGESWLNIAIFLSQANYGGGQRFWAFATLSTFNMISSFGHLQMKKLRIKFVQTFS